MNYVESLNLFGVEAKEIPCIKGSGAPNDSTVGAVGLLYMNTDNGDMYKCTSVNGSSYVWAPMESPNQVSGWNAVQYVAQTLTPEQQAQARANIGASHDVTRTNPYLGEKITLSSHKYDYKRLFSLGAFGQDGHSQQDACLHGDYYFQFSADGYFCVYELSTLTYLGSFPLDKVEEITPHCNSACFSHTYYSEDDAFPLLYVNAYNNTGLPKGTCYVHRITQSGGTFSTTLVQIINIGFVDDDMWLSTSNEFRPYGNFVVDREKNSLYAYVTRDKDNTTRFFEFVLPEVRQATSLTHDSFYYYYEVGDCFDETAISGGNIVSNSSYWITDLIKVSPGDVIFVNKPVYKYAIYDSSKVYITDIARYRGPGSADNCVIPDNCEYLRIQFNSANASYDEYETLVVYGLYNKDSVYGYSSDSNMAGMAINDAGEIVSNTACWITDFIDVGENELLWSNVSIYKALFYDSDKNFLRGKYPDDKNIVHHTSDARYIRLQYNIESGIRYENSDLVCLLNYVPSFNTAVTLSLNDIKRYFDVAHFSIPQGCAYHNGKLYVASGFGQSHMAGCYLHVVDLLSECEVSTIDFANKISGEPESVEIYEDSLLYGASGAIYKLEF